MRALLRCRAFFVCSTLVAPMMTFQAGCGDNSAPGTATVSEAEKKSVASYEAEIAKEKEAAHAKHKAK